MGSLGIAKTHALLRIVAIILLILVACLLGFDSETEDMLLIRRKATFKDLNSLYVAVHVFSVMAGYNFLRLCASFFCTNLKGSHVSLAWLSFLLDQLAVYVTIATNSRALQGSLMAVMGQDDFQWMELCTKFSRFCSQVGGALLCGYVACIVMISLSSLSAFHLFRFYSPKRFMVLKNA